MTRGRRHLCLYTVADYPSPAVWEATMTVLADFPNIVHETSVVLGPPGNGVGSEIRRALDHCRAHAIGPGEVAHAYRHLRPNVALIHNAGCMPAPVREATVEALAGAFTTLLPSEADAAFHACVRRAGCRLATEASPRQPRSFAIDSARAATGFVYVQCAQTTGAKMFAPGEVAALASALRNAGIAVPLFAGFGIAGAQDVRRLARVSELDGVIVGSALLARMRGGLDAPAGRFSRALRRFVEALLEALEGATDDHESRA